MKHKTATLLPVNKDLLDEFKRAYHREYYRQNKEKMRQTNRDWYQQNKKQKNETRQRWNADNPDKVTAHRRKNWKLHGQGYDAKKRLKGCSPLNEKFDGAHGHHVDNDQVIYIPEELHRSVYHNLGTGQGMPEINALAFQYLFKHT